jgi:preflagellin peptidase FlaK
MNPYLGYLDLARTALALGMLGYGSYRDLKTREVHDLLWVVFGAVALVLDVYELFLGTLGLTQLLYAVGFIAVVGLALWFFRLMGEADIFAFVVLVLIHPKAPSYLGTAWGWTPIFFPFTLLSNAALAGAATPLVTLINNYVARLRGVNLFERAEGVSAPKRLALLCTARYVRVESIRGPPFEYPLEGSGGIRVRPDIWDDEAAEKVFSELKEKGYGRTWVSSTLPYIVVMAAGYLLAVVFGDFIFRVLFTLL